MIYRFFVALTFTVLIFPFAAMYTFAAVYPDAHFGFDRQTWLQGMAPIAFGWVLFLLPGLLPWVGHRYYGWVARKTGVSAVWQASVNGIRRLRDTARWARLKLQTAIASRSSGDEPKQSLRERLSALSDSYRTWRAASAEAAAAANDGDPKNGSNGANQVRLANAKAAIKEAPKHIAGMKGKLDNLLHHLTPDELDKTIDLNQYTLEMFSHLKGVLETAMPAIDLDPEDRSFCAAVIDAIPEPPSPSAVDAPLPTYTFVYPGDRRDQLKAHAANSRVSIRDADYQLAAQGDLERALLLVKGIVAHECRNNSAIPDPAADDLVVGLPITESA